MIEEKFKVLKTLVALCHVDGQACRNERLFLEESLEKNDFSDQQKREIRQDFQQPLDPAKLFVDIDSPKMRGWLLYMARLLFFKDGDYSPEEDKMMALFQNHHSQTIDLSAIVLEAKQEASKLEANWAADKFDERMNKFYSPI